MLTQLKAALARRDGHPAAGLAAGLAEDLLGVAALFALLFVALAVPAAV